MNLVYLCVREGERKAKKDDIGCSDATFSGSPAPYRGNIKKDKRKDHDRIVAIQQVVLCNDKRNTPRNTRNVDLGIQGKAPSSSNNMWKISERLAELAER